MGNPVGFLELDRVELDYEDPKQRVNHYREFVHYLSPENAKKQAGRCMDCGTPFCNNGCPVNNVIPDFNNLVYDLDWENALDVLHSTNNFPEFTGRVCPAPCEAACTLNYNDLPVGIKSIEQAIIDYGWKNGLVFPKPSTIKTSKKIAIVGSGPAGMAAAQQLARVGHLVTVFEKNSRIGGLLRYGIPDFKMEKSHIDKRVTQMEKEGILFKTSVLVSNVKDVKGLSCDNRKTISAVELLLNFDAVLLTGGAEHPRDLPVPGRNLDGVHYAMDFLPLQNKINAGDVLKNQIRADGKHVIVIGGGDTGSDCVGTSNRHGAKSVTQFELMPTPPDSEEKELVWPYWPQKLRTSSSHEEGCDREFAIATKEFIEENGKVVGLKACKVEWKGKSFEEIEGSEEIYPADLVLLAMGFVSPMSYLLDSFGVMKDSRGNANAPCEGNNAYQTNVKKVFTAGDMRRGQSLVVWAIREGRQSARAIDEYLMGKTSLPD
jgi:glutamate synthase (NADPH/NADH) small chain